MRAPDDSRELVRRPHLWDEFAVSESAKRFGQHEWNGTAEASRGGIEAPTENHLPRELALPKFALDDAVQRSRRPSSISRRWHWLWVF